jgi:hypothetical protein
MGPQQSYQRQQADWLGPKEALTWIKGGEREGNYDRAAAIAQGRVGYMSKGPRPPTCVPFGIVLAAAG